jgi:queuine tRNA-ribosyltransferase
VTQDFRFELSARDGAARRGRIACAHGTVETPAFMPVGTAATVKAMTPEALIETGAEIVLANTYHLMLRPGAERVERLGGLHRFMNWPKPILTDSGGYQVMSLSELRQIDEDGVSFRSHIDGSRHLLTPERSIQIQHMLDADISMAFDECTRFPATVEEAASSMRRSMRWAERSRAAFQPRERFRLVRHRAGRCLSGATGGIGRGAESDRVRGLCHRRSCRGGGAGDDVPDGGSEHASSA